MHVAATMRGASLFELDVAGGGVPQARLQAVYFRLRRHSLLLPHPRSGSHSVGLPGLLAIGNLLSVVLSGCCTQ